MAIVIVKKSTHVRKARTAERVVRARRLFKSVTRFIAASLVIVAVCAPRPAAAEKLETGPKIEFLGELAEPDQLSGLAVHGEFLVVAPDEGAKLNVLRRREPLSYELMRSPGLLINNAELDLEGVASDGRHLYALGSSSLRRKKLDATDSYAKNRAHLTEISSQAGRYNLWQMELTAGGEPKNIKHVDLTLIIANDLLLRPFTRIPGKENGIDLEGLALRDGQLFIGCRGPVLRDNYVPVIIFNFERPQDYRMRFVHLDGRGIRDLAAVDEGFLILGGPGGDGDETFAIYWWDGRDCIPGVGSPGGRIVKLGTIDPKKDARPEGLAVLETTAEQWNVMIVCDGSPKPMHLKVPRP
jgi:hypothetical protein